jgi:hypothetical protein
MQVTNELIPSLEKKQEEFIEFLIERLELLQSNYKYYGHSLYYIDVKMKDLVYIIPKFEDFLLELFGIEIDCCEFFGEFYEKYKSIFDKVRGKI